MDEDAAKFYQLTKQAWVSAVKAIAPVHHVDAGDLLKKVPSFPVDPTKPGQLEAAFTELRLSEDDMTQVELMVCMLAHEAMVETIWKTIKSELPSEGADTKGAGV